MKVKEESEKVGLKLNIQKTKIMASGPITSWETDGETVEQWLTLSFWAPKLLQMVIVAMKLRCVLLGTEKAMASHSSTLAWKIPWMEESGRLQSMGLLRIGHNWATSLSLFSFTHWRRKWQPTPVFLLGESQRQWAPVCGVAQSRTRLKRLSSSSSRNLAEIV